MKSLSPNFLEKKQFLLEEIEGLTSGNETTLHTHAYAQSDLLSLEAGEDLIVGDPAYVSANKLYKADSTTNYKVVGIISVAALATFTATATISGKITLSGLVANSPYFLTSPSGISVTPPTSGYIIRLGLAISATTLIINIEEPILLN